MPEQLVYNGYTPMSVWDELEQRSIQTRIDFAPQCPVCRAPVQHTGKTDLRCLRCNNPVAVFQERHLSPNADRRVIFVEVNGQSSDVIKLDLQCLSCERTIHKGEFCQNTCEIQTYLMLEQDTGELYIKRWVNSLNVPRDIPEIPIRPVIGEETDTPENHTAFKATESSSSPLPSKDNENQPYAVNTSIPDSPPNQHKDVAGQILKYLSENGGIGKTDKMREAIGCSPQGFNKAIKKLIDNGRVKKIARGIYELINRP